MAIGPGSMQDDDADSRHLESVPLTQHTPKDSPQPSEVNRDALKSIRLQRSWLSLSFDCILMLLPLIFMASQHHKPESASGDQIQDILLLSPTIFPIVFAAICGKAMKSLALYKSQTGTSLRLLELLSGASSLFSALERVFLLRTFGTLSIATAILWILSPLGGQALSPRLLTKERFYANSTQEATFLGPDFLNSTPLDSGSGAATALSRVTTVYLSSLASSAEVRASPRDVWGNPKTSIVNWDDGEADGDGWKSIPTTNDTSSYTNLLGLPVKVFDDRTTSEFTVSSVDLEVQCSSLESTDTATFKENLKEPLVDNLAGGWYPNGTTIFFRPAYPSAGLATSFLYTTKASWARFEADITQPFKIFYGSRAPTNPTSKSRNGLDISLATCTMLPRGIESRIACVGKVCRAIAARRVPAELKVIWPILAIMRRGHFCEMGSSSHVNEPGQTEHFLASGGVTYVQYTLHRLYEVPLADFERRFQQVINTFWYAAASQIFSTSNFSSTQDSRHARKAAAAVLEDLGIICRRF